MSGRWNISTEDLTNLSGCETLYESPRSGGSKGNQMNQNDARNLTREIAVFDTYAGLRRIGYTWLGALRALRTLGISLREAKQAADTYSGQQESK